MLIANTENGLFEITSTDQTFKLRNCVVFPTDFRFCRSSDVHRCSNSGEKFSWKRPKKVVRIIVL